jgi:hypothetical protein
MASGPRIIFKDDRDSSIGRGCILYAAHLRPEVIAIVRAAALEAPEGLEVITISEGWRDIRERRDLHEEARAFDISLNGIPGPDEIREAVGDDWGARIAKRLGGDYDVIVHGEGSNLHIHVELDP